ncbi:MAG: hypothetical protein V5783_01155 [Pontiella sp.]
MIKSIPILTLLIATVLTGCTPELQKTYPQDRLTVEYTMDRENILIGERAELIVTAFYPTNGTLVLPEIGRKKDVILLARDWTHVPREDGLTQSETRYALTSFRLGEHPISTGMISCAVGELLFSTNFPAVNLLVGTSLSDADSTTLADIKGMQKLPGRIPKWIWIGLGSALAAVAIGLITSKLLKNRKTLLPSAPSIPPHVLAFQALETLQHRGLLEQNECNPFYTELSLILRTYLEGRFCLHAPDETTEEFVEEMSRSPELDGSQKGILQEFMRQADIVKFAKGHPDRSTMELAFSTTKQFVEETKMTGGLAAKVHREHPEGAE